MKESIRELLTAYVDSEIPAIHRKIRGFDAPADLHAVFSAMVSKGEFGAFESYAYSVWDDRFPYQKRQIPFIPWLFCLSDPSQIGEMMEMVANFIAKSSS